MAEYLHGAYGVINTVGNKVADESQGAIVYIGTAPVQNVAGGDKNVNKPILVRNMAEARKYLGYSDSWTDYTLCEAMYVHFQNKGVGPLIMINVLDPAKHRALTEKTVGKTPSDGAFTITDAENILLSTLVVGTKTEGTDYTVAYDSDTKVITVTEKTAGALGSLELTVTYSEVTVTTVSKTPSNGVITIAEAERIILDSVAVATKTKGTDYSVSYDTDRKRITIRELSSGALGSSALSITYKTVNPASVTSDDVIGTTDGLGENTGIYAIKDVYTVTGYIPAFLAAPGFSSVPAIHEVMYQNSRKINGHWDAYMFVDIPIAYNDTDVTLDTAVTFKTTNKYNRENETVYFPLAEDTDGKIYHISVLAAANFQELLNDNDGIPYRTASNTPCPIIKNLYMGAGNTGRVYDDSIINEKLNKNGIASAAFVGGQWVIWGAHSADYDQTTQDYINVSETNRMMLYYISNDFQERRTADVDKVLTTNDIRAIVSDEQTRLDALININALCFGTVSLSASEDAASDIINGDWTFEFNVTTTPQARSLTAIVSWTEDGFVTFFEDLT